MPEILEKPLPPPDGACCESSCSPCVWDYYYTDLKAWRLQQVEIATQSETKS